MFKCFPDFSPKIPQIWMNQEKEIGLMRCDNSKKNGSRRRVWLILNQNSELLFDVLKDFLGFLYY